MRARSLVGRLWLSLLWVVPAAAALAGEPPPGAPPWRLGLPWEPALEAALLRQRQAESRGVGAHALLERAARAARRETGVARLYVLARAYGLRAQARGAAEPQAAEADRASARSTYAEVLALAPRCYPAHHDLGILALQESAAATGTAFGHFRAAYEINPRYTPTLRQLARLYLEGKQPGHAVGVLQGILREEPGDHEARARLAVALAEVGRLAEADAAFGILLQDVGSRQRWLLLRAQTDLRTGRPQRSLTTWKELARANPYQRAPYLGVLACLDALEALGRPAPDEEYLFALSGLRRVEREPAARERLLQDMRRIEHRMAAPPAAGGGGAPTPAQLRHALDAPDVAPRVRALRVLMAQPGAADADLVRAVARHLVPAREPAAAVRAAAVRVLGRVAGTRLIPLVRHALVDPEAGVRLEAVDTLAAIAGRDPDAGPLVAAILGVHVDARPVACAAAAQQALLAIGRSRLTGVEADSDVEAWRAAFLHWWHGPQGLDLQVRGLEAYHRSGDAAADQVLVPYLASEHFVVFRAACEALQRVARRDGDDAWARWWQALPAFGEARLKNEQWPSLRVEMEAWVRNRPRG